MADKSEMRSKIVSLKKDQEALKRELAELDTFMERKRSTRTIERPRREEPRRTRRVEDVRKRRAPRRRDYEDDYEEPRRRPSGGGEIEDLLRTNVKETEEMIDKFDYLLDVLLDSMEEVETANTDEIIKTLAETQSHTIDLLDNIRTTLDATKATNATKEELEEFERNQARNYQEMNKKMATILDQVTTPPYLQELDAIRVTVSNLNSQIKEIRTGTGGGVSEELKEQVTTLKTTAASLEERLSTINQSMESVGQKLNAVQSTTSALGSLEAQLEAMEKKLLAHDEQILVETDKKSQQVEQRIADLDKHLESITGIEERLGKATEALKALDEIPTESLQQIADMKTEFAELRKTMPKQNLSELNAKLDSMDASMKELLKKKGRNSISPFAGEGLTKLEDRVGTLERAVRAGEVMDYYTTKRDTEKLQELFSDVEGIRTEVKALEFKPGAAPATGLKQLRDDVEALKKVPKGKPFENALARLREEQEHALGDMRDDITELRSEAKVPASVEEKLRELERMVKASAATGTESLKHNNARLNAMEQQLKKLRTASPPEATEMADKLAQVIESIRMKGELTVKDLGKLTEGMEEVESMHSQLDSLQDDVKRLKRVRGTPVDSVAEHMERLETKSTVDATVKELRRQLNDLQASHDGLALRMQGTKAVDSTVRTRENEDFQHKLTELHDQISSIKEQHLDGRITKVASRLQGVAATMQTQDRVRKSQVDELQGAITHLDEEAAKSKDVKKQLAEIKARMATTNDVTRLKELYRSLGERNTALEQRLMNDETVNKLVRIKEHKELTNALDSITSGLKEVQAQNLDSRLGKNAAKLESIATQMRGADTATMQQLVELKEAYTELKGHVAYSKDVTQRFHEISKELGSLDQVVEDAKASAAKQRAEAETRVKTGISELDKKLAIMQQQAQQMHVKEVVGLEKKIGSAMAGLDAIKRDVEQDDENYLKLTKQVDDIHERTTELVNKLGAGQQEDKRIRVELARLQDTLKKLDESTVHGLDYSNAMRRVKEEIAGLENDLGALREADKHHAKEQKVSQAQLTTIAGLVKELDEKTEGELVAKMKDSHKKLEKAESIGEVKMELAELREDTGADKETFKRELHRVENIETAVAEGQKTEMKKGIKELGEEVGKHEKKLGHRPAQGKLGKSVEKLKEVLFKGGGKESEAQELRQDLFRVEHELSTGNPEYQKLADRVAEVKEKMAGFIDKGAKPKELAIAKNLLIEVQEDLLDLELEKRGMQEALSRVRECNQALAGKNPDYDGIRSVLRDAHKLLEYERETLNDLRIDLKAAHARFPEVDKILKRREREEKALTKAITEKPEATKEVDAEYAKFKRSIDRMRAAREAIKREEPKDAKPVKAAGILRKELNLLKEDSELADTKSLERAEGELKKMSEEVDHGIAIPDFGPAVEMLGEAGLKAKEAQRAVEERQIAKPQTREALASKDATLQVASEKLASAQAKLESVKAKPLPPPPGVTLSPEQLVLKAIGSLPPGGSTTIPEIANVTGVPVAQVRAELSISRKGVTVRGNIVRRT